MISGALEAGIALLLGITGGIYIIGQIKENAKRNQEDIKTIRELIAQYQVSTRDLIEKMVKDTKDLLDANKEHEQDNLNREISHVKTLISMMNNETREDIKRLEAAQRESNKVKERLALAEASVRSLHKRLDIDPVTLINKDEER